MIRLDDQFFAEQKEDHFCSGQVCSQSLINIRAKTGEEERRRNRDEWGWRPGEERKRRGKEGWSSGPHQCFFPLLSPCSQICGVCVCVRTGNVFPQRGHSQTSSLNTSAQRLPSDWPWWLHTTRCVSASSCGCEPLIKWVRHWLHVFACELSCASVCKCVCVKEREL